MTCASCVANIERMVSPATVPGLISISVNLMSEQAMVEHNASILPAEEIAKAIDNLGFKASVVSSKELFSDNASTDSTIDTTTLKIYGMTCASCVSNVESALLRLPDVNARCSPRSQTFRRRNQHQAVTATHVQDILVTFKR